MKRRDLLKASALAGLAALSPRASAAADAAGCSTADGTPNQFIPKKPADPAPLVNELDKYPHCPYCGMNRREHHRARMLVQYSDDLVDGVCSIHCLAISLSLNIDRSPKNIWGPDYGSTAEPRPLTPVDDMVYLIGADLKHAMTRRSKHSFASPSTAREFQGRHGGELGNFSDALRETHLDMAGDVDMVRRNRAERRRRAQEKSPG